MIKEKLIKIIEKDFRRDDDFKNKKKNEILKTILLNVARFDSNAKITKMIKIIILTKSKFKIKNKKRKFKKKKSQKLLFLFNVYTNLHFINNAIKYVIIINSNVLIEKLKHKYVKKNLIYND